MEGLRLCFFFSSRRRHTRYWRDWSSDVCSSDLRRLFLVVERRQGERAGVEGGRPRLFGPARGGEVEGHDLVVAHGEQRALAEHHVVARAGGPRLAALVVPLGRQPLPPPQLVALGP